MAKKSWKDMNDFTESVGIFVAKELETIAANMFQSIVEKTPIDTGLLRTNWKMTRDVQQGVLTITISNNTPYAHDVEFGIPPQRAGVFMVQSTLDAVITDFL